MNDYTNTHTGPTPDIAGHAIALPITNGPVTVANTLSHPTRPFADTLSQTLNPSSLAVASWVSIPSLPRAVSLAHTVPHTPPQRAQKLHSIRPLTLTDADQIAKWQGEELHAQPDSQGRLARCEEHKGEYALFAQPPALFDQLVNLWLQIVVEALTKNVKEAHIREIFSKFGAIKDLRMPMNPVCT